MNSKTKEIVQAVIPIVIVIVAAIVLYKLVDQFGGGVSGAVKSLGQTLGLSPSDEAAAAQQSIDTIVNRLNNAGYDDYFNPGFYKTTKQTLKTGASIDSMAAQVYNAIGWFLDDQASIVTAFKDCENQSQVSQMADSFQRQFNGKDLLTYLNSTLSGSTSSDNDKIAFQTILNYTESLS